MCLFLQNENQLNVYLGRVCTTHKKNGITNDVELEIKLKLAKFIYSN